MGRYGEIWGDAGRYDEEGVSASAVLAREEALVGDDGRDEDRLVDEERVDDEEEEAYRATHAAEPAHRIRHLWR